jgi:hypothetical protein
MNISAIFLKKVGSKNTLTQNSVRESVCYTDARKSVPECCYGLRPEKELPEWCSNTRIPVWASE